MKFKSRVKPHPQPNHPTKQGARSGKQFSKTAIVAGTVMAAPVFAMVGASVINANSQDSNSSSVTTTVNNLSATTTAANTSTTATVLPAATSPSTTVSTTTPINNGTNSQSYPQTPLLNPTLPVIQTSHRSDHIKANVLNPFPVCNASEDSRTVVYRVSDNWLPVGTLSTFNQTNVPIALKQLTSKTQTIAISVNGNASQTASANFGGNASSSQGGTSVGNQYGIAFSLARSIGGQASYSLSWNLGQEIGPYQVPAGYTGEATYGFRAVNMTGTQQFCKADGTWSTPTAWVAFVPIKNEVRVKLYNNIADSANNNTQPDWNYTAPMPTPATGVDMTAPSLQADYDLQPYMTVSSAKAQGFAGAAALHIKNVGKESYYGEFPVVSFLVEVKTASGPNGVDRVITPSWYSGAYVQDLGFNRAKSTRSFLVTLSNPIYTGKDVTVASFNFNDGNTQLGRITNYVTISQIGRVEGDTSYYNDTLVDSRTTSKDDFGNQIAGIF